MNCIFFFTFYSGPEFAANNFRYATIRIRIINNIPGAISTKEYLPTISWQILKTFLKFNSRTYVNQKTQNINFASTFIIIISQNLLRDELTNLNVFYIWCDRFAKIIFCCTSFPCIYFSKGVSNTFIYTRYIFFDNFICFQRLNVYACVCVCVFLVCLSQSSICYVLARYTHIFWQYTDFENDL